MWATASVAGESIPSNTRISTGHTWGKSSEDTVGEFENAYARLVNSAMKRLRALSAVLYRVACLPNFSSNKMRSRKASSASSWGSKAVDV